MPVDLPESDGSPTEARGDAGDDDRQQDATPREIRRPWKYLCRYCREPGCRGLLRTRNDNRMLPGLDQRQYQARGKQQMTIGKMRLRMAYTKYKRKHGADR